ncbi:MAG: hypothetical protein KDD61_00805 [Bdellovibrionales bacterium]|nr:hypothetical protein [Bdellovibrionales bacterium]
MLHFLKITTALIVFSGAVVYTLPAFTNEVPMVETEKPWLPPLKVSTNSPHENSCKDPLENLLRGLTDSNKPVCSLNRNLLSTPSMAIAN